MSMEMKQKSGDNSQLIQAGTIIINNGITEDRARQIFQEESAKITAYTQEAHSIAYERIHKLEDSFMVASSKIDGALESFADPAFQLLLKDAAERAAATEREEDYDLLSQLLICHIQKGEDRKNRAGIHRAIQIVDEIDNDALCALTVLHAASSVFPLAGSCAKGLKVQEDMVSKLLDTDLPKNDNWMDHLDVLGAIRINSFGKMKPMKEFYAKALNGYVCAGIAKGSDKHEKALALLDAYPYMKDILVDNELLDGYIRIDLPNDEAIDELVLITDTTQAGMSSIPAPTEIKNTLKEIWGFYSDEATLLEQVKQKFNDTFDSFEHLSIVRTWWDSLPHSMNITGVGKVLAHTNAKRCDPSIPDLL